MGEPKVDFREELSLSVVGMDGKREKKELVMCPDAKVRGSSLGGGQVEDLLSYRRIGTEVGVEIAFVLPLDGGAGGELDGVIVLVVVFRLTFCRHSLGGDLNVRNIVGRTWRPGYRSF